MSNKIIKIVAVMSDGSMTPISQLHNVVNGLSVSKVVQPKNPMNPADNENIAYTINILLPNALDEI